MSTVGSHIFQHSKLPRRRSFFDCLVVCHRGRSCGATRLQFRSEDVARNKRGQRRHRIAGGCECYVWDLSTLQRIMFWGRRDQQEVAMADIAQPEVVNLLNKILEQELAGVVRYTHYSFLIFGFNRIPIVGWLREQANESLIHAQQAGEMITLLGAYPSLGIGPLLDQHRHDVGAILQETMEAEEVALGLYKELLDLVEGRSVVLEEYARSMIYAEELHGAEVDKMMRRPMVDGTAASTSGGYQL